MKKLLLLLITFFFSISCSKEDSDDFLLEKDRLTMKESLDSDAILRYKFGKICVRASVEKDTISEEFQSFKKDMDLIFNKVMNQKTESLSVFDYVKIYHNYKKMNKFIEKTDEDIFPTLLDAINVAYADSLVVKPEFLKGQEKIEVQNIEHAIFSVFAMASSSLGTDVAFYECSKTNPDLIEDGEIKSLLQFFRGFVFFQKKVFYLSENETTQNISWLDKNQNLDLPITKALFGWKNLGQKETFTAFHSMNHLFRGFDRLMMDREIDEKRAMEDFEAFLKDSKEIGADNEIIWSIEAFMYIKNEENEKAIVSLNKLKKSPLISKSDKQNIDESISYLKERNNGDKLNTVYDKFFLSKVSMSFMMDKLSKVDWEKLLRSYDVPHTKEMFEIINNFQEFVNTFQKYKDGKALKETTKNIEKESEKIWDNAKGLLKRD